MIHTRLAVTPSDPARREAISAALFSAGAEGLVEEGAAFVTVFLLEWFYPVFFEVYRNGATPGKQALNLAVVQDDGIPVGWSASMVRNLLRTADLLPFLYGCGLLSMMWFGPCLSAALTR